MTTLLLATNGNISKNAKAWYGRLNLPDIFGSAQLSVILGTLAESAIYLRSAIASDTWLKIHRKRTGEDHTIKIIYRFSQG